MVLAFPRLVTPQWVGQDGVEAVVVLAIDDMGSDKVELYETFSAADPGSIETASTDVRA